MMGEDRAKKIELSSTTENAKGCTHGVVTEPALPRTTGGDVTALEHQNQIIKSPKIQPNLHLKPTNRGKKPHQDAIFGRIVGAVTKPAPEPEVEERCCCTRLGLLWHL
jgi:hypothetical protein